MTSFTLKIIGVIAMLFDHIGDAIIGRFSILNLIGRFAFPIFAYQSIESYIHTKNIKKYLARLFIFALISQIPFSLFQKTYTNEFHLNVMFTFLLGIISLIIHDKINDKYLKILPIIFVATINEIIRADYGAFGIVLIYTFYYLEKIYHYKNKKIVTIISIFLLCNFRYIFPMINNPEYITEYFLLGLFTSMSVFIIILHNKKEGKKMKYFFYFFYPLHLLMLAYIHYNLL